MFCYSDSAPRSSTPVNVWAMNATKAYMTHYANFLFLDFIMNHGTYAEQQQARKELTICERKLRFWAKHPNYEAEIVRREKEKLHVAWKRGERPDVSAFVKPRSTVTKPSIRIKTVAKPFEPDF